MRNPRSTSAAGFTLVELLVVIAIIAVLVTVTITMTFRFRNSADRTNAMNAMRQLQSANISFAMDNSGSFVPPEAKQLNSEGAETGVTYQWFENPDFIAHLKGEQATFSGGGEPDVSLPATLMDLAVIRAKSAANTGLDDCFGYTAPSSGPAYRQAQLKNPANSAAFITFDGPFVDYQSREQIAYRHQDKALVVYYDGRAAMLSRADISRIASDGGASNVFWNATGAPVEDP